VSRGLSISTEAEHAKGLRKSVRRSVDDSGADLPQQRAQTISLIRDDVPMQVVVHNMVINESPDEVDDPEFIEGLSYVPMRPLNLIQYLVELPFSFLRYISMPTYDGKWGYNRRLLSCLSITGAGLLIAISQSADGMDVLDDPVGKINVYGLMFLLGIPISILLLLFSSPLYLPRFYPFFGVLCFVASIEWMNLFANELVNGLESLGKLWQLPTTLIGMVILALANSVGDLAADVAVARAGSPATAVTSCFASPLLNYLVGLGLALTVTCLRQFPEPFEAVIDFAVYMSFIFLLVNLVVILVVFTKLDRKPLPKVMGYLLIVFYFVFLITASVVLLV